MEFAAPFDWPGGSWEATLLGAAVIVAVITAVIWTIAVSWTFRDVCERTSSLPLRGLAVLTVAVLFLLGLWIYRVLRPRYLLSERFERRLIEEALLRDLADAPVCPRCSGSVRDDFLYCPSCSAVLKKRCLACARPIVPKWRLCPYCGRRPAGEGAEPAASPGAAAINPAPATASNRPVPKTAALRLAGQRTVLFERADGEIVPDALPT